MPFNRKRNMTDVELKQWMETQYDVNENGCWVWKRTKSSFGHGNIHYGKEMAKVHRVYWLLSGRTIPEGLGLLHGKGCSKACFNPDHLHPGDQSENALDQHRDGTMTQARLTPEQVLEIRARNDKNQYELAEEYGVAQQHISAIINRQKWRHI